MIKWGLLCVFLLVAGNFPLTAKSLSTSDYLKLEEKDKQKLIQKYIKLDKDGTSKVNLRFYELFSNCDSEATIETAVKMDEFYEKFSRIFKGSFKNRKKPQLFCLADKASYSRVISDYTQGYVNAGWSAGMFISIGTKGALFADFSVGSEVQETLFHEGTHQLMSSYTGGAKIPVWLDEGIATNFESWEIQRSAIQNLHRTAFDSGRRYGLFQQYNETSELPLDELLNMTSKEWSESTKPGPNYSMSWLMVNTLLLSDSGKKLINAWMTGFRKKTTLDKMLSSKSKAVLKTMITNHYRKFLLPLHKVCLPAVEQKPDYASFIKALESYTGGEKNEHPILTYYRVTLNPDLSIKEKLSQLSKLERESVQHPNLFGEMARLCFEAQDKFKGIRYQKLAMREDPLNDSLVNLQE